jgi:hypothetical protein
MAVLGAMLVFMAILAHAATRNTAMRIKILDSETRSVVIDDSGVPKNCDQLNYDAYCNSSKTEQVTNTLVIEDGTGTQYRVACGIETKYSKCIPLPKGETFDAHKEKHGINIYYQDDDGKARKQFYAFVASDKKLASARTPAAVVTQPAASAAQSSPSPAAEPGAAIPTPQAATGELRATVKCRVSSTPAGAEVTVDGRYVGSTPSVLGLTLGDHAVVISMPGFAQWKRELTVASGSELTVNAVLQKTR